MGDENINKRGGEIMDRIKLLVIIFFVTVILNLSLKNSWATDGYFWEKISEREKEAYVTGLIEGAVSLGVEVLFKIDNDLIKKDIEQTIDMYDLKHQFTVTQVVEGINSFYSNYANKQIPTEEACLVVLKKFRGVSEYELQKYIEVLRTASSEERLRKQNE